MNELVSRESIVHRDQGSMTYCLYRYIPIAPEPTTRTRDTAAMVYQINISQEFNLQLVAQIWKNSDWERYSFEYHRVPNDGMA
jgi:hypothetical protein